MKKFLKQINFLYNSNNLSKLTISVFFCLAVGVLFNLTSCSTASKTRKLSEGFYEMEFEITNYNAVFSILKGEKPATAEDFVKAPIRFDLGFTSSIKQGDFFARCYNDYFTDNATFLVRTKNNSYLKTEKNADTFVQKYATVGLASGIDSMNDKFVKNAYKFDTYYKVLPYLIVDGMNEYGVVASISTYPILDFAPNVIIDLNRQGYYSEKRKNEIMRELMKPKERLSFVEQIAQGKVLNYRDVNIINPNADSIYTIMVVRYILDHATSASHAVELLKRVKIVDYPMVDGKDRGYHIFISDSENNYTVNFDNGEIVVTPDTNIVTDFSFNDTSSLVMMGRERYDFLYDKARDMVDKRSVINVMKQLYYSNAYDVSRGKDFWFTECYTDKGLFAFVTPSLTRSDTTYNDNIVYDAYYEKVKGNQLNIRNIRNNYSPRAKNKNIIYTSHISVYDTQKKKLTVIAKENSAEYDFDLINSNEK